MYKTFVKDDVQVCFDFEIYKLGTIESMYYDGDGLQYDCGSLDSIQLDVRDEDVDGAEETPEQFYDMLTESVASEYGCDNVTII